MQLIKTVDSENILRLEEDGGASVTVKKSDDTGQILSITVPKDERREGIGSALLSAAEQSLISEGIKKIGGDFPDTISGMDAFFENAGYTIQKGAPIVSVEMKALLASLTVKRAMASEIEDAFFVPFSDLMVDQLDSLLELLSSFKINLGNSDIARSLQEASGVVYDDKDTPQAFILCSETDNGILVDLLAAIGGSNPKYIISAMKGMLTGIINRGGAKSFQKLTIIACNQNINALLSRVLKKGVDPELVGYTQYACKKISKSELFDIDIEEDLDEDLEDEWRREIKKVSLQSNISWKMDWNRETMGDDSSSAAPASRTHSKPKPVSTSVINFQKDEDEDEGLIMDNTIRITMDNLSRFADIMPDDVYQNMPRPFYRGLAVIDGEDIVASIVWEYKNIEDDIDTEARIEWFFADDNDAAISLMREYTSEISSESVVKSFFELTELSESNRSALSDAGFKISREESDDVIVTLEVLKKQAFAQKEPASYIKSIDTLNEKQFKRGITNSLFHNRKGLLEDAVFLTIPWFETSVSCCVVADKKVVGLFLLHKCSSGDIFTDLLFSAGAEYQTDLLNMLRFAVYSASSKYPDSTKVVIRRHDNDIKLLVSKLIPDLNGDTVYYGERSES